MKDTGVVFLNYLDKIGLKIGTKLKITEVYEFDGSMEVEADQENSMTISKQVADNLLVVSE